MLHVVTVATESQYYLPYLQDTCARGGVNLKILGLGEKWNGYIFKLEKMVDFLRSVDIGDIVCFVDGYDVICTRHLDTLVREFLTICERENCQIVIAKDSGIIPEFISSTYFGSCKNIFINSGTYIGFAGDILRVLLESMDKFPTEKDDQRLLTQYCNLYPNIFYIDTRAELFYTANTYPLTNAKIVGAPYFVHAPGCGYLDSILEDMGYDVDKSIKPKLRSYFFRKSGEHTCVFLMKNIYWIIFFILLIVLITANK